MSRKVYLSWVNAYYLSGWLKDPHHHVYLSSSQPLSVSFSFLLGPIFLRCCWMSFRWACPLLWPTKGFGPIQPSVFEVPHLFVKYARESACKRYLTKYFKHFEHFFEQILLVFHLLSIKVWACNWSYGLGSSGVSCDGTSEIFGSEESAI